jgi:Squalene-hopene cyclase C-terminal domain/Prenyltransferase and squalene oxidase repeat
VSWQLACFGLLAMVLVGGVVWYERSRPPAKLIALVAALAALAVAGRLVLAPVPNVVATTDIVLISGYSLGGAPGFAVGALAALVSNFWLGQGPWTPWQMAGWGLVGIGGAALAAASGRRLGRLSLAAACGVAGLAYGALLDLSVMVTYGGEQSLDRYLALSARGIPFNLAHAAGNVAFALIAGPALVRMLLRFRSRIEVDWRQPAAPPARRRRARAADAIAAVLLAVSLIAASHAAPAAEAAGGKVAGARAWLARVQNPDGGFGASPGTDSSVGMTTWAVLGLESAGRHPADVARGRHSALDFLRRHSGEVRSTTDLERAILAVEGAGLDADRFAGRDLVSELASRRRPSGSFRDQVNITAFGVLALRAAGEPRSSLDRSRRWLREAQNRDGGWGLAAGGVSESDTTGAALQALAAAGAGSSSAARDGVRYLRRAQRGDGGWPLARGGPTNSQSTAWAVQGLLAVGADPGSRALRYLAARQDGDGHYSYSSASDQTPIWVTAQVLLAATGSPFPLEPVDRMAARSGPRGEKPAGGGSGSSARGGPGSTSSSSAPASAPGPKPRSRGGGEGGRRRGQRASQGRGSSRSARTGNAVAGAGQTVPAEPTLAGDEGEDGDLVPYLVAGFGVLLVALAGGYRWYRRRLPG